MMIAAPIQVTASGSTPHSVRSSSRPQTSALYSSGATREASARRNASVIAYCPIAPATPMPPTIHRSCARSGTQPGNANAPAPSAIKASSQKVIAWLGSVRANTRTVIADTA